MRGFIGTIFITIGIMLIGLSLIVQGLEFILAGSVFLGVLCIAPLFIGIGWFLIVFYG